MFYFCECQNEQCRFRYPVTDGRIGLDACPRCGGKTTIIHTITTTPQKTAPLPTKEQLSALLDNIRSVYNVGSIFRTADGAGLRHLYLGGITAPPTHPKIAKTALGAESSIGWSHHLNSVETAVSLKQQGHQLWALETAPNAIPLPKAKLPDHQPVTLIIGNEIAGIDPGLLALSDYILKIPMRGIKESLNVATAFGIAVYQLLDWDAEI
ncbi:MAG: TrmH family RNA methyltransferase [Candidatus Promineifilaceae bacterium]